METPFCYCGQGRMILLMAKTEKKLRKVFFPMSCSATTPPVFHLGGRCSSSIFFTTKSDYIPDWSSADGGHATEYSETAGTWTQPMTNNSANTDSACLLLFFVLGLFCCVTIVKILGL
ncbi:AIG2-like (avirulence induced gene) family protein [Striga asiatica]|uniref:AIG2-like (Avirulence induced gene) family protein n=1 Tax=Striga asiatica TaxID=4170 RepID=A0A5A7P495_STRAF|nr:AIG2-like (avirulence induced gene) family protein [Striga asiatica]